MRTVIALVVTVVLGLTLAGAAHALEVGDKAPDFELPGHRGTEKFRLCDYRGKKMQGVIRYIDVHKVVRKQV